MTGEVKPLDPASQFRKKSELEVGRAAGSGFLGLIQEPLGVRCLLIAQCSTVNDVPIASASLPGGTS